MTTSTITIRIGSRADEDQLRRLAALDTSPTPAAPALLAAEDGKLVAAISLIDGLEVANPFVASESALEVLRVRAAHIRQERLPSRRRLARWLRSVKAEPRARASLAGSPPGAGGQLLDLGARTGALSHPS